MGLFGRKKEASGDGSAMATTTGRQGWMAVCGPLCGFSVKDHEKKETAQILMLHMKQTHKTNLAEAEAFRELKPTTL